MGSNTLLSQVLVGFIILHLNEAVVFKFTNLVCTSLNESLVNVRECRLKAISRNRTILNAEINILRPLNDVIIKYQIFQKANGYKPWLYKASFDACQFMRRAYNPLAIILFKLFKEFTNMNHTCPYVGIAFIRGFYLRSHLLPHAIPTGDYMLDLYWVANKKGLINTKVYFAFVED